MAFRRLCDPRRESILIKKDRRDELHCSVEDSSRADLEKEGRVDTLAKDGRRRRCPLEGNLQCLDMVEGAVVASAVP